MAASLARLSDSGQRTRSVLLAAGTPRSRKTDQKPIFEAYCFSETALRACYLLQELQKQNALVLQLSPHLRLVRPDALVMMAIIKTYLNNDFENMFISGE